MRISLSPLAALTAALSFGLAAPSQADTVIEFIEQAAQSPQTPSTGVSGRTYISAGRLRLELPSEGRTLLFDAAKSSLIQVDHTRKQFSVIDPNSLNTLAAQMDGLRNQMSGFIDKLSPEQRAQMEAMGIALSKPNDLKPAYVRSGQFQTIQGIRCEQVRYTLAKHSGEFCLASAKALQLPKAEAQVLQDFAAFVDRSLAKLAATTSGIRMNFSEVAGLPLRMRHNQEAAHLAHKITRAPVDAKRFEVPAGYIETAFQLEP